MALSALGVIDLHDRAGGCVGFLLGIGADTALERFFAGKGLLRARRAPSKLRSLTPALVPRGGQQQILR